MCAVASPCNIVACLPQVDETGHMRVFVPGSFLHDSGELCRESLNKRVGSVAVHIARIALINAISTLLKMVDRHLRCTEQGIFYSSIGKKYTRTP